MKLNLPVNSLGYFDPKIKPEHGSIKSTYFSFLAVMCWFKMTQPTAMIKSMRSLMFAILSLSSLSTFAADSLYCPQNHGYIKLGMTPDQVISACGQPLSQQDSNRPVLQKIPVQQLVYNNQGGRTSFYGVWNITTGTGGSRLEVDIVDNKIKGIRLNGSDNNAFSICKGANIQVGDPVGLVYNACGSPSIVNNTYINEQVRTAQKPVVWIYQPGQFQPPFALTFVNGKLQSINN